MGRLIPRITAYNWMLVVLLATGPMASGYAMSCLSGAIGQHGFYVSMGYTDDVSAPGYRRTSQFLSAASGSFIGGASLGAVVIAGAADALGRKNSLQPASLIYLLGGGPPDWRYQPCHVSCSPSALGRRYGCSSGARTNVSSRTRHSRVSRLHGGNDGLHVCRW